MIENINTKTVRYRNWCNFVSKFGSELFNEGIINHGRYVFRGHGDVNYYLRSSFDRKFNYIPISQRVRKYEKMIKIFTRIYKKEIDEFKTEEEILSSAQHYGLPTRLLDWSSNPFVAAYFAFNGAALSEQRCGSIAIWALDTHSKLIHKQLGLSVFEAATKDNERATAQSGYFSHLTGIFDNLEEFANESDSQETPLITRFVLPVSEARSAFSYLNAVGFNARHLFPDIHGIAVATLEENWLEDVLGKEAGTA